MDAIKCSECFNNAELIFNECIDLNIILYSNHIFNYVSTQIKTFYLFQHSLTAIPHCLSRDIFCHLYKQKLKQQFYSNARKYFQRFTKGLRYITKLVRRKRQPCGMAQGYPRCCYVVRMGMFIQMMKTHL